MTNLTDDEIISRAMSILGRRRKGSPGSRRKGTGAGRPRKYPQCSQAPYHNFNRAGRCACGVTAEWATD